MWPLMPKKFSLQALLVNNNDKIMKYRILNSIWLFIEPKVEVNLKVRTMGVAQRTGPIGSTSLPKVGRVFDPSTGTFDNIPFVDHKTIFGTTTTVWPKYKNLILNYNYFIYNFLVGSYRKLTYCHYWHENWKAYSPS